MTKIESVWAALESEPANHYGLLYKRYSAEVLPDLFVSIKSPEKLRGLAIRIGSAYIFKEHQWNTFKDIKVETFRDESDGSKVYLVILLLNKIHKDVFSTLCEDLIYGVSDIRDEQILVEKLLERLAKWQSLFAKIGKQGLSEEAQRGLYGEVYFLRVYLENCLDKYSCVKAWQGSAKAIQDFQLRNWALEVKTTHGNNHQKIHVSSERQLDDSIIDNIYLFHLSLDVREGNGESLNALIDDVLLLLGGNTMALNLFQLKLLEYGFYDIHRSIYDEKGYAVRMQNVYKVFGSFPRIVESQVPKGVGDVKYSIVLSESEEWRINITDLFEVIKIID